MKLTVLRVFFLNLLVQEKWMQRCEQNEWSDASWEHICFYRKVELWTDEVLDPEFTYIILNQLFHCYNIFFCPFLFLFIRKVNGPGTPRPLNRPKVSLANSLAANGLPDSTDNKDLNTEQEDDKDSRYVRSYNTPETLLSMLNMNSLENFHLHPSFLLRLSVRFQRREVPWGARWRTNTQTQKRTWKPSSRRWRDLSSARTRRRTKMRRMKRKSRKWTHWGLHMPLASQKRQKPWSRRKRRRRSSTARRMKPPAVLLPLKTKVDYIDGNVLWAVQATHWKELGSKDTINRLWCPLAELGHLFIRGTELKLMSLIYNSLQ